MLGMRQFVKFFKDNEEANDYGYYLEWKSSKTQYSRIARRLQQVRDMWDPQMRWRSFKTYVVGKIQYASCLYWLRASKENIEEVRFFYCMAMAAVMGLTAPEVVSMVCCSNQRVSAKNKGYLKACEFLNLPTIEDLAAESACALLRQWTSFRPEQFVFSEDEDHTLVDVAEGEGDLLRELFKLSKRERSDWYPEFNAAKGPARGLIDFDDEEVPLWRRYWSEVGDSLGDSDASFNKLSNGVFMRMCREHFKVLEPVVRVTKRLSVAISKTVKRRRPDDGSDDGDQPAAKEPRILAPEDEPADVSVESLDTTVNQDESDSSSNAVSGSSQAPAASSSRKRKRTGEEILAELTCFVPLPLVRGRKRRPCRICGYAIAKLKKREADAGVVNEAILDCCKRPVHIGCWYAARCKRDCDVNCKSLVCLLRKDRMTKILVPKEAASLSTTEEKSYAFCKYCRKNIDLADDSGKTHLADECEALSGFRNESGEPKSKLRKLADRCVVLTRIECETRERASRKPSERRAEGVEDQSPDGAVSANSQIT